MNDLFVVVVVGGGGVSHQCSITTSSIEELEKKARVVSFERDERERERVTTRIYIFENRHPKCEHTTQQDIIISIIESKRIASSRLVPLQPRLGSPRARVISRFLSPRRSSFFSSS